MTRWMEMIQSQTDCKKRCRDYFLIYTVLFIIAAIAVFFTYIVNDRCLIWQADGIRQNYPALMYFGKWLRTIIKSVLFEHRFTLPEWDFSIGYGADVITTLNYYCIGDPLTLTSAFVPARYTEYLYNALCIIRLYLAGAAFSCFCFRMKKGRMASMAGTFSYVFCAYALFASIRHPYFINPMIYLPLLLIGIERIFHKEKPTLFVIMVFISIVSNFYFFYMLVIAVVFYVGVRYFTFPHEKLLNEIIPWVLKFAGYSLVGIAMSAVIVLPVLLLFSGGMRNTAGVTHPLLYSYTYYSGMITKLLASNSPGSWTWLGLTGPGLLGIFLLFGKKKAGTALKVPFCILTIFLLIPAVGRAMNGFTYVCNRWSWIYIALCSYILVYIWQDFFFAEKRQILFAAAGSGCYLILLLILDRGVTENSFAGAAVLLAALVLILVKPYLNKKWLYTAMPVCLFIMVLCHVCMNAHYYYDYREENYVSKFPESGKAYAIKTEGCAKAVQLVSAESGHFGRFEKGVDTDSDRNSEMLTNTFGTSFTWSLANGNISRYLFQMGLNDWKTYAFLGNDKRTFLDALASVEYFAVPSGYSDTIPYGYEEPKEIATANGQYVIYKNRYALPLAYTYDSYIAYDDFLHMTAPECQEALMQGIVLEEDAASGLADSIPETEINYEQKKIDYEVTCGSNVVRQEDGSFLVGAANAGIILDFEGVKNCETYLYAEGVKASAKSKLELYQDDNADILPLAAYDQLSAFEKNKLRYTDFLKTDWNDTEFVIGVASGSSKSKFVYRTSNDIYYFGQEDFLVNLGYQEKARSSITITFPMPGVYDFEDLSVICQPMKQYTKQVNLRKADVLNDEVVGNDMVSGSIKLNQDKILCLSIPYEKGWSAYVDGKKVELLKANLMYMAIPLEAGEHTIQLIYHTYGLKVGLCISVIGIFLFVGILLFHCRQKKKADLNGA